MIFLTLASLLVEILEKLKKNKLEAVCASIFRNESISSLEEAKGEEGIHTNSEDSNIDLLKN